MTALSRREAIRRILAASAVLGSIDGIVYSDEARRIGFDPDLLKKEIPWPRLMTDAEKKTATALADIILPAAALGPAASVVGVPDFLDEWISAPYDSQVKDRDVIRPGLEWLDKESKRVNGSAFADLKSDQQTAILDSILTEGSPQNKAAGKFFRTFRDRAGAGYFTTQDGWKALGYTGNLPSLEFAGPSAEALKHIGL
ncbi:MAG: Tat pathway signal protein [Verrucomicrobiales bacterium VVV1]|nr:MAG: Tat pathway signal protein [Verrucomicrobiales bacterium VVV1]